ncbi:PEP-CTERM sorting domain-containing protein [Microcoleus sp.]|uniref:PEP-CTERM sorting domain-containing protein n=1 Tax=Microcoleus sp. TaxID=44472 RepID=UPI00403EE8C0
MTQQPQGRQIPFDDRPGNDMEFHHSTASGELDPEPVPLPVPEPVTLFGTILGIGALAVARRKKKRGQQREK